jgi:hypothetical protein
VFPSASSISFLLQVIDTAPAKAPKAVPGDDEQEYDEEVRSTSLNTLFISFFF